MRSLSAPLLSRSGGVEQLEHRVLLANTPISFSGSQAATFKDADGGTVVVSLKGPGSGTVEFAADGNADASRINLDGTSGVSSLSIKGTTAVGSFVVNGSLRSLGSKTIDLAGPLTVTGSLPKLQLRNAYNSVITIGATPSMTVTIGSVTDVSLTVAGEMKSLKVTQWTDADATPDLITATNIRSVTAKGNFTAGISAGGSIDKVSVGGALSGSEIRANGGIGTIIALTLNHSTVFAGINPAITGVVTSVGDFSNGIASIKSITLKGKGPGTFSDSRIASPTIGKLALGPIATFDGFVPFGITADRLTSFSASTNLRGPFRLGVQDPPTVAVLEDDFVLRIV
jgi:hypothetical protein